MQNQAPTVISNEDVYSLRTFPCKALATLLCHWTPSVRRGSGAAAPGGIQLFPSSPSQPNYSQGLPFPTANSHHAQEKSFIEEAFFLTFWDSPAPPAYSLSVFFSSPDNQSTDTAPWLEAERRGSRLGSKRIRCQRQWGVLKRQLCSERSRGLCRGTVGCVIES